ncbi:hypothetical protein EUGRSUZ_F02658 [Eucalyptus grandis]|uniref:Uncharacterized protein n=2 Tax=Eucalyptus grandis TaxID=71139 RepID=A0ACC3KJD2_EUCGR|nr:hypothetical protein EUGRSUZ_F02658 [Eucalyptus grandis]
MKENIILIILGGLEVAKLTLCLVGEHTNMNRTTLPLSYSLSYSCCFTPDIKYRCWSSTRFFLAEKSSSQFL